VIARDGHLDSVKKAREFAEDLRREMPHTGNVPVTYPSICGGGLSVPTYLSGNPQCFGLPEYMEAATEPVTLWVALNAWGSISAERVAQRSLAVLGLASLIDDERPVNLNVYQYSTVAEGNGDTCVVYPLGVRPVDWAMSGALLGHTGMYRAASFGVISTHSCKGDPGDWSSCGTMQFGRENRREVLRMKEDDIHIGVWESSDSNMNPKDWVRMWYEKLEKQALVGTQQTGGTSSE